MRTAPIVGVFDSGIGGLSVLRACLRTCPGAHFLYYGDNRHAPYGSRPPEEIARFTGNALRLFARRRADVAVIACNTATAVCIDEMRRKFSFPIVGVEPAVGEAAKHHRDILVLATPRTAESERLKTLLERFPEAHFTVLPLPRLAAAIEDHFCRKGRLTLPEHFPPLPCDCAVLGCTHYALIGREIAEYLHVPVYDGTLGTARRVKELLQIGTADHHPTPAEVFDKNIFSSNFSKNSVTFLGNSKHMNENVMRANICFQCF